MEALDHTLWKNSLWKRLWSARKADCEMNEWPFPTRCYVRQGCPVSMLLFALVLSPLLYLLEQNLLGIRIGHRTKKTAVVAYADNVTICVTEPEDIRSVRDLQRIYEGAMSACLNIRKCQDMAAGSWDTSINTVDIPYCPE